MSLWLGSLIVHIRISPPQDLLPTESRSTDQPSALEIILLERHKLLQLGEMFSVAVLEAQGIDMQSGLQCLAPDKTSDEPLGKSVDWINHYALQKDLEKGRFCSTNAILGRIIRMISCVYNTSIAKGVPTFQVKLTSYSLEEPFLGG